MALHHDLLETAKYLLGKKEPPTDSALRHAISTAYYSVFHLLIDAACSNWARPEHRDSLARAFEHRHMFNASRRQVSKYLKAAENSTENRLSYVADRFVELQEMREAADYERNAEISPFRARLAVELAEKVFQTS